jgi:hypothetical protein
MALLHACEIAPGKFAKVECALLVARVMGDTVFNISV